MDEEFLVRTFVTRWFILFGLMIFVDAIIYLRKIVFKNLPQFSNAYYKNYYPKLMNFYWIFLMSAMLVIHYNNFLEHMSNIAAAIGAGLLVTYGIMSALFTYMAARRMQTPFLWSSLIILLFPLAIKIIEPDLLKIFIN
jgi:hypothetical protein